MKSFFVISFLLLVTLGLSAQNKSDIEKTISESLEEFASALSQLNDIDEPVSSESIEYLFGGTHYFLVNGTEASLKSFLNNYRNHILDGNYIIHELDITPRSIRKTSSDTSDYRWSVSATLKRSKDEGRDFLIKDVPIDFVVRWNGKDKRVTLLGISFEQKLSIVRPVIKYDYKFEVDLDGTNISVPYYGGNWKCSIISQYREIKTYPGIVGKDEYGSYKPLDFEVKGDNYNFEKNNNVVTGSFRNNVSKYERCVSYIFTQERTEKVIECRICQPTKSKSEFFSVDDDISHEINLFYSMKYDFGLSYMGKFEDSRFALGLLMGANFDFYRGREPITFTTSMMLWGEINIGKPEEITFYKIHKEVTKPNTSNYSALMDPNAEAIHYTSRALVLLQGGYFVTNWFRIDLGMGLATSRDLHFMETAYAISKYSYEKMDESLPDIDDVYGYKAYYKDYYYKDKTKCYFALRPAANFRIPITDRWEQQYITIGLGYTYVPASKKASSLDFSLGYSWTL